MASHIEFGNMDWQELLRSIFNIDKRIRYAAILDGRFDLIESKMRENVKSVTPDSTDREFMSVVPAIVLDAVGQLVRYCGTLKAVTLRYEKLTLVFYTIANKVIAVSFEPDVDTQAIDTTREAISKLVS